MLVSILIPTFNRLGYLREALQSARAQTHGELEILVSDDGSTDGSREHVAEVAAEDPRVRLLTDNPRRGIFTNMQHLIDRSSGEAFALLGDDDRLLPSYVEALLRPLADPAVVASFCDHWVIDGTGHRLAEGTDLTSRRYGRDALAEGAVADRVGMALSQTMCLGFSLFRSSAFKAERFDLQAGPAADWDYLLRASAVGELVYVKERLGEYRVHPGTATSARSPAMAEGIFHVFASRRFDRPEHERRRRQILRDAARSHAFDAAAQRPMAGLRSVGRYLSLGGSPLDLKIAASVALALAPRPLAVRLQRLLRR
jgi:glycosyltransferase involved in cell wall biosynthesis